MSLAQRIETLRKRHAQLEDQLKAEEHRPMPDIVKLHKFKRTKLILKDRIVALAHEDSAGEARQSTG
jgi:hypothetical protein